MKKLDICNHLMYTVTNLLQIVIFTEEYMTKRLLTSLLALILVLGIFPIIEVGAVAENTLYDSDKALSYAKAHWNDGKGLCAEFVSDCLSAGGLSQVYNQRVVNLYNAILENNCGKSYKLVITNGSIKASENAGKIKKGDPIFFYCNVCKEFTHVSLCNGFNSDGYAIEYSHNNAHNGHTRTYTYPHCGTSNWTMYSISMYNEHSLFGAKQSIVAPRITAIGNATEGVYFRWNKVSGATYYRVYRRTQNSNWLFLCNTTATSYTDKTAKNNVEYTYTVRACKQSTFSQYYAGSTITHLSISKFKSFTNSNNSVTVTWNGNPVADGYYLYRQVNNGKWYRYADIKNGQTTSYTDKNVSSGNTYSYRIRTFKGAIVSSYDIAGIKGKCLTAPKLTSIANVNEGIRVNWSAVAGSTDYRVYRRAAGEKYWTYLCTTKDTYYIDSNVKSAGYYRYTIRSADGSTFGSFSSTGLLIRCISTPEITGAQYTSTGVRLNWKPVAGAKGYYVYHKTENAKYWRRIAVLGTQTTYVDSVPKKGETYFYTVKAFYGNTMSDYYHPGLKCICDEERGMQSIREETNVTTTIPSTIVPFSSTTSSSVLSTVPTTTPAELTTVSVTEPYTGN